LPFSNLVTSEVIQESKQGSQTNLKPPEDIQPENVDENELSSSYSGKKTQLRASLTIFVEANWYPHFSCLTFSGFCLYSWIFSWPILWI